MKPSQSNSLVKSPRKIDRDLYKPAYVQLADIVRAQVGQGELRPGDQLPSEAQFVERYGLSPMTIRRALNILIDEGVLSARQGKGTFVKPINLAQATFGLEDLRRLFGDEAHTSARLVEARVRSADETTALKLGIAPGDRVIFIRRLLCPDGKPAVYHREYLIYDPARPIVESEMEATALQRLFSGRGETVLKRGELSIETTLLTDEEARLLEVKQPASGFRIEHLFYGFDDRPISWGWFICRADRLRFRAHVGVATSQAGIDADTGEGR